MTSPPSDQTPIPQPGPGLRADAELNRCRILAAARRLYATEGLGASMASVAREAGVGKATLGRRFASREELVNAVFADRMDAYAEAAAEALADPDPWHGFTGYLHAICAMQAADRGFADVLTMTFPAAKALEARRAEAYDRLLELITRAKNTGHLREDFTHQDIVILLIANAGVVTATGDAAPDTWRRLLGHMIRSYAAPGAPIPPLPEAPAPTALHRAMVRLARTGADTDADQ
ncbi:helix-turn-helix domain containing protein [Streptomyces caniscabiei]|uniref:TetR/AcrR family transcriptional regulator n=1 Tax=Streptomyces caniscabiei TaxID=2746961 RepID=UPI0029B96CE3|nr:helix-turn-helix domain-containing protein [Streptomyces caniscabiei]MDX2604253.1 helix-turn-helix domain containing protein [Streptomyces caniscabiei]MDX2735595.1 helix-turn-helix domain containing protein [Streptomyces caniscabiei]MDX2777002.1 helix-turn-helix domain containing protein [Streptomyces caniscabiei]